jgi:hypothetical protein
LHDVDLAREQNEGTGRDLTGRENMSSGRIGSALSKPPDPAHFRRIEHRKHLVAPSFDQLQDSGISHGGASDRQTVIYEHVISNKYSQASRLPLRGDAISHSLRAARKSIAFLGRSGVEVQEF